MQLPLTQTSKEVLFKLLRALDELQCVYVLVGGLVPPLLRAALDPDAFDEPSELRRTVDCDLAIDVAVPGAGMWDQVATLLVEQGFTQQTKKNQFCWKHACGLWLDPMPVAAGIERGDPDAVAFAKRFEILDVALFFRGYELALQAHIVIEVDTEDGSSYPLRIAGLVSMLAMKLQAWNDRRHERKKDAHDIGWLLLHLSAEVVVRELRAAHALRPDLVAEILKRLKKDFADPEGRGVSHYVEQAHGPTNPYAEEHQGRLARRISDVLNLYSAG